MITIQKKLICCLWILALLTPRSSAVPQILTRRYWQLQEQQRAENARSRANHARAIRNQQSREPVPPLAYAEVVSHLVPQYDMLGAPVAQEVGRPRFMRPWAHTEPIEENLPLAEARVANDWLPYHYERGNNVESHGALPPSPQYEIQEDQVVGEQLEPQQPPPLQPVVSYEYQEDGFNN